MFILTLSNKVDGVFSVLDELKDQVIPIFEDADDAVRYNGMMELDENHPTLQVVEIDASSIINACEDRFQKYAIITKDDFLIPPKDLE
tara:strand:+ start:901 stop:1164 length:264 start_codon:yes stop_codon:yes gene_type:complete